MNLGAKGEYRCLKASTIRLRRKESRHSTRRRPGAIQPTFLSADRKKGSHVLESKAVDVTIDVCAMHEMHVPLPETVEISESQPQS
jgi:hypothetical protein